MATQDSKTNIFRFKFTSQFQEKLVALQKFINLMMPQSFEKIGMNGWKEIKQMLCKKHVTL